LLIRYFHSNRVSTYITIVVLALLQWLVTYFFSASPQPFVNQSEALKLINGIISQPFVNASCSFVLILFTAFFINIITQKEEVIIDKQNLLPGVLYLLALLMLPSLSKLHELVFINLTLLFAFSMLWGIYRVEMQFAKCFNIAFLFGVPTIFYTHYFIYILSLFISLAIIKPVRFKEVFIVLVGFICPFYLQQSLLYIINADWGQTLFSTSGIRAFSFSHLKIADVGPHAFILFMILLLLGLILLIGFQKNIKVKTLKARNTLFTILIFNLFYASVITPDLTTLIGLCFLPLCVLAADLISSIKNLKIANGILIIIFINSFLYILHLFGFLIYN
jgi:hypothetical protein